MANFTTTRFTTTTFSTFGGFADSDLVNVTTRAVAVPVREIYGFLLRAGVLEITG